MRVELLGLLQLGEEAPIELEGCRQVVQRLLVVFMIQISLAVP